MRCALELPALAPPLSIDEQGSLSASVELDWSGRHEPLRLSAIVDTGCAVDFIASRQLSADLSASLKPIRRTSLNWEQRIACDIYGAAIRLDDWYSVEIYAPLSQDLEDLLGLPAILRSNLCIRGVSNAAFWASTDDPTNPARWMGRDADLQPVNQSRGRASKRPAPRRK